MQNGPTNFLQQLKAELLFYEDKQFKTNSKVFLLREDSRGYIDINYVSHGVLEAEWKS
jgi:hypothetical protein